MNDARIGSETSYDDDPGDGGDVSAQRNPDSIQREIEQTRAELADTIDAIADRISPRRVASRGASAVRAQVTSVFGGSDGGSNGSAPASVLDAPADRAGKIDTAGRQAAVQEIAARGGGATYTGTGSYTVARRLRIDRVLLVLGLAAATAGAIVLWRSRD